MTRKEECYRYPATRLKKWKRTRVQRQGAAKSVAPPMANPNNVGLVIGAVIGGLAFSLVDISPARLGTIDHRFEESSAQTQAQYSSNSMMFRE